MESIGRFFEFWRKNTPPIAPRQFLSGDWSFVGSGQPHRATLGDPTPGLPYFIHNELTPSSHYDVILAPIAFRVELVILGSVRSQSPHFGTPHLGDDVFALDDCEPQIDLGILDTGAPSIEWFDRWVTTRDPAIRQRILDYNEDDCKATRVLLDGIRALGS